MIVSSVERRDGALFVTMRDRRSEADGDLTVAFDERTRALEEWTVRDRQGRQTRVRLTNVQPNARMAASLFATPGADRRFNPSGGR